MKKTQKSFRKKALLSSLSMLLVSTVAVGSATFAWFTQSPTATASGLTMKATSANGLKILTESRNASTTEGTDKTYASTDFLNYFKKDAHTDGGTNTTPFLLDPVSIQFTAGTTKLSEAKAYSTTAKKDNESKGDDAAEVKTITDATYNSGAYYEEDIMCKLVGAADPAATAQIKLSKLDIKFNTQASALQNSVRALISYNGTIIGAYAPTALNNQDAISAITESSPDSNKYYYGQATKGKVSFDAWSSVTSNATKELGTVHQTGADKVTVTIYLDGEHTDCKASNIDINTIISSVDVGLTIA